MHFPDMDLLGVPVARVARSTAFILGVSWLIFISFLYVYQRKMLFVPDPSRMSAKEARLTGVSEEIIATPDGEKLVAWWSPPKEGKPVILYFHGNGGNLSGRAGRMQLFQEAGFGALMLADRGYNGSTGSPSETALNADALLAFDGIVKRGIAPRRIVVFGESLGTGLAVHTAAHRTVGALILDSPYTSIVDIAARRMPFVPVRLLMSDRFDSLALITRVRAPLLIIHGEKDDVVPYDLGVQLFSAANEPKQMLTLPGAGHVTPLRDGPWKTVRHFIDRLKLEP